MLFLGKEIRFHLIFSSIVYFICNYNPYLLILIYFYSRSSYIFLTGFKHPFSSIVKPNRYYITNFSNPALKKPHRAAIISAHGTTDSRGAGRTEKRLRF